MRVELEVPKVDLIASLKWLRTGFSDPGVWSDAHRYAVAFRMQSGPVTLMLAPSSRTAVTCDLFGPGADEVVTLLPEICGALDDPDALIALTASIPRLASMARQRRLVRLPRVPWRYEIAVGTVLGQRVDTQSAEKSYADLSRRHGEPAPGDLGLRLLPPPDRLGGLPSHVYRALGVDGQRERALRALCEQHDRLTKAEPDVVREVLTSIPGFGPWTIESIMAYALGDADALPLGDYWYPHVVSNAFHGKPRSTDEEMEQTLEPYRPHRYRLLSVLMASGFGAQRFASRRRPDGGRGSA